MYPNLEAERARRNVTLAKLAEALDLTVPTVSLKLNGKYPITMDEARKIKECIGTDLPLEELFSEEVL